jgi:hypothetical protein
MSKKKKRRKETFVTGSIHSHGTNGLATRTVWQSFYCITGTRKIKTVYTITVIPTIILSSVITTVSVPLM